MNLYQPQGFFNQTVTVRSIFGDDVGPVLSSHFCSYHRQLGKMYISSNSICYYSNILGFERKIMIKIKDIKYASLHRTTSIMIRSLSNNESLLAASENQENEEQQQTLEEHIFRSFSDRQGVLLIIFDVYKQLMGNDFSNEIFEEKRYNVVSAIQDENNFATPLRKIFKRGSQDSKLRNDNGTALEDVDLNISREQRSLFPELENVGDGTPRSRCSTQDGPEDIRVPESSRLFVHKSRNTAQEWERIRNDSSTIYTEVAVERQLLPLSLNRFFELFLADGASKSMAFFQENIIQDDRVECTPWEAVNNRYSSMEGYKEFTRTISSSHNRSAWVGPKIVPLERRQTLRKFSNYGITINTVLKMEGVPYGDTFEVQDEWIIESCNEGQQIGMHVRFKVYFIKRPMAMVQKVIRDQSRKEVTSWFSMYMEMIHEQVGGEKRIVREKLFTKDKLWSACRRVWDCVVSLFSARNCLMALVGVLVYYIMQLCDRITAIEWILYDIQVHKRDDEDQVGYSFAKWQ